MDTPNARPVLDAAEHAASGGDYALAAERLREALALQEAQLGTKHPELAHTLNNLGVMCELSGDSDEAEVCYQRAVAVATATLPPEHAFVTTSRQNLQDFYAARPARQRQAAERTQRARAKSMAFKARPWLWPSLAVCSLLLVTAVWSATRTSSTDMSRRAAASPLGALPGAPAPTLAAEPPPAAELPPADRVPDAPAGTPADAPASPTETVAAVAAPESPAAPEAERRVRDTSTPIAVAASTPVVADARLCSSLAVPRGRGGRPAWSCDPAGGAVDAGPLFFYTRIRADRGATVQHRWYHDGALRQSIDLRIPPNGDPGYRTYSRRSLRPDDTGEWRVELRTANGRVLHEERFVVPQ